MPFHHHLPSKIESFIFQKNKKNSALFVSFSLRTPHLHFLFDFFFSLTVPHLNGKAPFPYSIALVLFWIEILLGTETENKLHNSNSLFYSIYCGET